METERCESCMNVKFDGNNGKNCTCRINGNIIPNIDTVPIWCPLKRGYNTDQH